jgi:hypothetical protein
MDFIFDMIDNDDINSINNCLRNLNIKDLTIQVMINILTCTLSIHNKLPYRKDFFNLVKEEIITREGSLRIDKGLISGLDGENYQSCKSALNWIRRNVTGEKEVK